MEPAKISIPCKQSTNCKECGRYLGIRAGERLCSQFCKARFEQKKQNAIRRANLEKHRAENPHCCCQCKIPMKNPGICRKCRKLNRKEATKRLTKKLKLTNPRDIEQIRSKVNPFFESHVWQKLRYETLKKYGRKCMVCFASNVELHVDHIKPRSKYPYLALDPSNLQVLCRFCNLGKSNRDEIDWREKNCSEGVKPQERLEVETDESSLVVD